ncbi:MAG: EscU/YscU/HrcU family type III secretion system export apparatus switch protein [Candidatus Goldiibacteriota bacterium]
MDEKKKAVAVEYDKEKDGAPRITAKGRGAMAEKIIELAGQNNIPLHEDPDLIEILSQLDLGREIPPEMYKLIAEVLVYVYRSNNKAGKF